MGPSESRAETEVSQFNVTGRVDQNVVRLNISVDESHAVDTLNRAGKLRNVKSESWKKIILLRYNRFEVCNFSLKSLTIANFGALVTW